MNLFDIVSLSDKLTPKKAPILNRYYLKHGYKLIKRKHRLDDYVSLNDPVAVILGGVQVISQILPNLFGAEIAKPEDFLQLFPGSGQLTTRFRNYLQQRIKYKKDIVRDLPLYTHNFIKENIYEFSKTGTYDQQAINNFYSILRKEAAGGGSQIYPPIYGRNINEYIPYIIAGGIVLVMLAARKRK